MCTENINAAKSSEIPVIDDKEAVKILSSGYCKDQFDNQHDNVGCCVESMEAAWKALKPYLPVRESINLESADWIDKRITAYAAYKKEWQLSEDEAPDYLVWCNAWDTAARALKTQIEDEK